MSFDTFELHPLPEAALKALQAAASTDGCPEGLAVVGGLTEVGGWGDACSASSGNFNIELGWSMDAGWERGGARAPLGRG